jgi:hypothetical protein
MHRLIIEKTHLHSQNQKGDWTNVKIVSSSWRKYEIL